LLDAEENLKDAIKAVADAQDDIVDAKQAVIDAQDAIREASDKVAESIQEQADAYKDLEDSIKKAKKAAEDAGKQFVPPNLSAVQGTTLSTFGQVDPSVVPLLPSLPMVPTPSMIPPGQPGVNSGPTIVVNTGVGTNGIEAGRQIVQLLQQYTAVDAFAIDKLGFAPRR
jgi:ABC-type transporter Mla subunit MlaD